MDIDPGEPYAANIVRAGGGLIFPGGVSEDARAARRALDFASGPSEAGELAKAEGAVTCCSLIFEG